ncbi:MAG: PHP domain-containing protein [Ruminococcaceae bacterium]|nr:PHP domain-containing protein [Oscillospiraceae bacterium]
MFKTEMHCHSAHVSACGHVKADQIIEKYLEAGYTTIVSTEHLNSETFSEELEKGSWQDRVSYFMEGYNHLVDAAKGRINILLGAEIATPNTGWNDFLVYGLTEDFLRSIDDPRCAANAGALSSIMHKGGAMFFQAHPFREHMQVTNPGILDGIEIGNFNFWVESNNDIAQAWATKYNLIGITGTDFHLHEHKPTGGIITEYPITDNETLLKTLRERNFSTLWD